MIRTKKRMRLCVTLLVCILVFIWGNSMMPANISETFSDSVREILIDFLYGNDEQEGDGGLIRKLAHFTEFGALGMCLGWLFGMLEKGKLRPFLLGAAAAFLDETIQIFVPGRFSALTDVLIDSSGVAAGIILLYIGHTYLKKRSAKHSLEDS